MGSLSEGDLPTPGVEPMSPALQADSLPAEPQGKPKNTGLGSLPLLQQIFLTQELNQGLLHCRWVLYQLSYEESPTTTEEERREKKRKKYKRIYRTNRKVRTINVFLESLLSESFPSLGVTVPLTSLGCPPALCWSLDLLWGQLRF